MFIRQLSLLLCILFFVRSVCADRGAAGTLALDLPKQHALVVGIDHYEHITNLNGAVNDAKLLTKALRRAGVLLPKKRILLNKRATRDTFIRAWRHMLKQADLGDTLIITFAGHGGQEPDHIPLGEADKKDETLIFYDFKKNNAQGRITDDELFGLFESARDYKILVVIDACHSSGMVRDPSRKKMLGQVRSSGYWNIRTEAVSKLPKSREGIALNHVTFITGVNQDHLGVPEIRINNTYHGALSWFFAQAIGGEADGNQNGSLERNELERFLVEKIGHLMNKQQIPKILPASDQVSVFNLGQSFAFSEEQTDAALVFETSQGQTKVFNQTGDTISTFSNTQYKQAVIDKQRFLKRLDTAFDMRLFPIKIYLKEGDKVHQQGSYLHFSIIPGNADEGLHALTLFSLGSQGKLDFLYPLSEYGDPLNIAHFPYHVPPMIVDSSIGSDTLVAILCPTPSFALHRLLARKAPRLPKIEQILDLLQGCQVGQYAVFSR